MTAEKSWWSEMSYFDNFVYFVGAVTIPVFAYNVAQARGLVRKQTKTEEGNTDAVFDMIVLPVALIGGLYAGGRAIASAVKGRDASETAR